MSNQVTLATLQRHRIRHALKRDGKVFLLVQQKKPIGLSSLVLFTESRPSSFWDCCRFCEKVPSKQPMGREPDNL